MTISKKVLGVAVALLVGALVGGYFLFLSPKSTTVKISIASAAMAANDKQTVSGTVSPAEAGRLVIVEVRGEGAWAEAARTSTDETGVYKVEFEMPERGDQEVRVRVESHGRQQEVTSALRSVKVLSSTQLQVQIPKFARTDRPLRITGRLGPAATRTVTVESSTEGQTWTRAGQASSKASGQFTVTASGLSAGQVQLRLVIAESETHAATTGKVQMVNVEDYAAAGKRYLKIVEAANKLLGEWGDANDGENLATIKDVAKRLSAAYTIEAKLFRRYAYWPQEVKTQVETLAKASVLRADFFHQVANVTTLSDFYSIDFEDAKGSNSAPAFIRSALDLPKRG